MKSEVLIVSPYFIPGKVGMNEMAALRRQGVRVVVLTNSLASTDVAAVHAGYLRYRKEMLRMGVELYENKPSGGWRRRGPGRFLDWLDADDEDRASLHAKTFTFDRRRLFVGSLNLDPRSIRINTELGIVIENGDLARLFTEAVMRDIEKNAYRLSLEGNRMVWTAVEEGRSVRFTREPETTPLQRFAVGALSWLPIEGQL
jgi:putative cardiolipin synthase